MQPVARSLTPRTAATIFVLMEQREQDARW